MTFMHLSTESPVTSCGLPLCGLLAVVPKHINFSIMLLRVDHETSSREEILQTDLLLVPL